MRIRIMPKGHVMFDADDDEEEIQVITVYLPKGRLRIIIDAERGEDGAWMEYSADEQLEVGYRGEMFRRKDNEVSFERKKKESSDNGGGE